ncbi:MAG: DNA-binding protein [Candidatus Ranarchaeia archaeon]
MAGEDELAAIRQRRAAELKKQLSEQQAQEIQRQQIAAQKAQILRGILTTKARDRLNNLKLARPELAEQVENQLILLRQSGRLQGLINDSELKRILVQMMGNKRETKIEFR